MAQKVDLANRNITAMSNDEQKLVLEELKISRALLEYQQQQQQQHPQQLPRIPHIPTFTGDASRGFDYQYWKGLIRSLEVNYTDASIIQAIRKSVSGQPAQIVGTLPVDCTLQTIINALDTAYDLILDAPTAWQRFYNAKQSPRESVVEWHTRLIRIWSQIPGHGMAELHIKKRLWDGLHSDQVRESTRHHYDNDDVTEVEFVKYLRRLVEGKQTTSKATINALQSTEQNENSELRLQVAALNARLDAMSTTTPNYPRAQQHDDSLNPNDIYVNDSKPQHHRKRQSRFHNNNHPAVYHNQSYQEPRYNNAPPRQQTWYNRNADATYDHRQYSSPDHRNQYSGSRNNSQQQSGSTYNNQPHYSRPNNNQQQTSFEYNRQQPSGNGYTNRGINCIQMREQMSNYKDNNRSAHDILFGHNYCNAIATTRGSRKDYLRSRIIGKINTERVKVGTTWCDALIDSGSSISSISEEFYLRYLKDTPIQSLDDLFGGELNITSATSDKLNIIGYIETTICVPGVSHPIDAALTVIAGSILNKDMPVLIGSNMLEAWKDALMPHSGRTPFTVDGKTICASVVLPRRITVPATVHVVQSDPATTTYPRPQTTVNDASAMNNDRSNSRNQRQSNNVETTTNDNLIHSQDYGTPKQYMPQYSKQYHQAATCNDQQYQTHRYEDQSYQQSTLTINPIKIDDRNSWYDTIIRPTCHERPLRVNRSMNKKIVPYYEHSYDSDAHTVDHQDSSDSETNRYFHSMYTSY